MLSGRSGLFCSLADTSSPALLPPLDPGAPSELQAQVCEGPGALLPTHLHCWGWCVEKSRKVYV